MHGSFHGFFSVRTASLHFFVIVYHLPPKASWGIICSYLFIDAFEWSIHIWFNFLLLTFVWKILHHYKAATGIYGLIFTLYIMFFVWIYLYTFLLLEPFWGILRLLPDICY